VLRHLAEELAKDLDAVLDAVLRAVRSRRTRTSAAIIPSAALWRNG
jgi:hypothetical protein